MSTYLTELIGARELLFSWTLRDFKVRYSQAILGIAWAILQPFALMLIFSIVFSVFLKVPTQDVPFPVFAYCGLLPWIFFANALGTAIPSLIGNLNLITKLYFPHEILPLSAVIVSFFDFVIASSIFVPMLMYYHISIGLTVLLLPLVILIQFILTLGISLIASAMNVFYRDIRFVIPLLLQLWMYMSPVFYSPDVVPTRFRPFYFLNPMAVLIDTYRRLILFNQMPDWPYLGLATLITVLLTVVAYHYFKNTEQTFADLI